MHVPRLLKVVGVTFFVFGLLIVPISAPSAAHAVYYKIFLYFAAASFFWVWLYRDARAHRVSRPWQLVVAVGWLVAAIPVVPAYLILTRGWQRGSIATLAMLAIVLVTFALLAAGSLISTLTANALGHSASAA